MPEFLINLSWEKDTAGYDLLAATPNTVLGATLLTANEKPLRIVARGGHLIRYEPLALGELYTRFAGVHTADDLLEFINKYGPLTEMGQRGDIGENVEHILEHTSVFRSWLEQDDTDTTLRNWLKDGDKRISQLDVYLVEDEKSGKVNFQYRPPSLLIALWLQMMQQMIGDRPYRECPHCKRWFQVGPGTGRRLDAQYCTPEHQILFNRRKQSAKGRERHA